MGKIVAVQTEPERCFFRLVSEDRPYADILRAMEMEARALN